MIFLFIPDLCQAFMGDIAKGQRAAGFKAVLKYMKQGTALSLPVPL